MSLSLLNSSLFDLLDDFDRMGSIKSTYLPAADVIENESEFEVAVSAPGMNKSDFKVKVDDGLLIISGEKKKLEKKYTFKESFEGSFVRKFRLPKHVKIDEIAATYTDGILTVKIPKDIAAIKKKEIEIH